MNDVSHALRSLVLPCAFAAGLAACAQPGVSETPATPAAPAAPAPAQPPTATGPAVAPRAYATFTDAKTTAEGGAFEGFAYAEKQGDAGLGAVATAGGATRVTGFTGAGKGSTWAGLGLMVQGAPNGAVADLSGYRSLRIALSAATPTPLRIRLVGADATTVNNGCYPVVVQNVGPELRTYDLPFSAFAPEGYCGAQGKAAAATLPGLTAVEVSAPTTETAKRRDVDFRVGAITVLR